MIAGRPALLCVLVVGGLRVEFGLLHSPNSTRSNWFARTRMFRGSCASRIMPPCSGMDEQAHPRHSVVVRLACCAHSPTRVESLEAAAKRFQVRSDGLEAQQRGDFTAWRGNGGSIDEFQEMQARVDGVLAARSCTLEVAPIFGDKEYSYRCLVEALWHS